ncbi:MAG: FAD-dependent oxidoreductase, partial [Candidatus Levyibacteriota bacterium]
LVARTPSLAYPEGGFLSFANHLVSVIQEKKGKVFFDTEVIEVTDKEKVTIVYNKANKKHTEIFDEVIYTTPSFLFLKTLPQLPEEYKKTFARLKSLGATNLILRLRQPFFQDNTYWLSVCDLQSPVMAIVEHTNFMDKKHYNNEHLLYLGNYVSPDDPKYLMTKDEQLKLFDPFLKKINPQYKDLLIGYQLFKAPFAQPIIPTNYSRMIPEMDTPLPHVFLANIDQVYPWDRGTSNAVALGQKIVRHICQK